MSGISVERTAHANRTYLFKVMIENHEYKVSLTDSYYLYITDGKISPDELVAQSFKFLLAHEDVTKILPEFDLPLINTYFSEYEKTLRNQYR